MDLGLGFDDDDLCVENKEVKQPLTSYNAKTCHTEWFLTAEGDDDEARSNIRKYRADYYFGKQHYQLAVDSYIEGLTYLSSQNRVMRKDMLESLARCYGYLGDREQALKIVTELMSDVSTTDNMVQILILKQQILSMFGMVKDEIEVIEELTVFHPYNAQFWLMLVTAYKQLMSSETDKSCPFEKKEKYSADTENSDNCNQSHDLEKKVEMSLTLNGSESQEGHLESCVTCSEKTDTCHFTHNKTVLDAHESAGNFLKNDKASKTDTEMAQNTSSDTVKKKKDHFCTETIKGSENAGLNTNCSACCDTACSQKDSVEYNDRQLESTQCFSTICHHKKDTEPQNVSEKELKSNSTNSIHRTAKTGIPSQLIILTFCIRARFVSYGSLPKYSNTLNIRTPKIIAKNNFKMFPKISNSG